MTESAYILRRVERNGRSNPEKLESWSIRQIAVYHQYVKERDNCDTLDVTTNTATENLQSVFYLICPSSNAEQQIGKYLSMCNTDEHAISPWRLQSLLVADSLKGWADYMACLQHELKMLVSHQFIPKTLPKAFGADIHLE